jgi:hypothetical protein
MTREMPETVTNYKLDGKRRVGRPGAEWTDDVNSNISIRNWRIQD